LLGSIGLAVLWGGQTPPILSRVIVVLVFSETTLSAEVKRIGDSCTRRKSPIFEIAVCDVHRSVHVRLVLAHPACTVRTFERRLLWAIPYLTARMALFRGVTWVNRFDGDALLDGFVAYLGVEFGEFPSVETAVHVLAGIHLHKI